MKNFQRLTLTAILAGSALLATGCGGSAPQAPTASPDVASPVATVVASPVATVSPEPTAAVSGIITKGVANDGKGVYLQTSIADTDPAMQYNPAITDDAAKAHYSVAELEEAHKFAVRFIAEEAIDSTLNGGSTDVDGWWAAHKNEILPSNQGIMLEGLQTGQDDKSGLARESWMLKNPDLSYVHGAGTPRVLTRTITPTALAFSDGSTNVDAIQGLWLDANVTYSMAVNDSIHRRTSNTTGKLSFAVAKDATDGGKWKIAGYQVEYHTLG